MTFSLFTNSFVQTVRETDGQPIGRDIKIDRQTDAKTLTNRITELTCLGYVGGKLLVKPHGDIQS